MGNRRRAMELMQKLNKADVWLDNIYYPCHDQLTDAGWTEEAATKALSLAIDFQFDMVEFTNELCEEVIDYNKLISKDCE